MEIQYVYQKKRSEFGRQCMFSDKGPDLIDNYPTDRDLVYNFILRDPVSQGSQCSAVQAEHFLNTTRAEYSNSGVNHSEGGWPKDINLHDEEQTKRYRRKIEKDDAYSVTMLQLCKSMENCILQNNAINIYQQYFSEIEPTPLSERSSARTVNVYADQNPIKRPVNHISWSPDMGTKLAITHCNIKFQLNLATESTHAYIWEIENPNRPLLVLKPAIPSVCIEYHQKDPNSLISGQFDGKVAIWDIRRGTEPVDQSVMEVSHRDPVCKALWINSKSGTEFFSASSDGQVKWWDTRKLSVPLETLIISTPIQDIDRAQGVSSLEYEPSIPTRFMLGTELGVIISCNRKGKSPNEKMPLRFNAHYGPVVALQRSPTFVKNFLSIGDWTAKIWSEDCRESAIMWTSFHKARLTDACWSPTRLSSYFVARSDGTLDVWDVLQTQQQASLSVKVCDAPLRRLRTQEMGRLVAVGNEIGSTYLVQFSDNLAVSNKNDKMLLTAMFERESKREKILEARNRELRLKIKIMSSIHQNMVDQSHDDIEAEKVEESAVALESDPYVTTAEEEFFHVIDLETKGPEPPKEEEPPAPEPEPEPEPVQPPPTPVEEEQPKKKEKKGKKKA